MGGLDWGALDTVCALLGIENPDLLIHQLVVLRNAQSTGGAYG